MPGPHHRSHPCRRHDGACRCRLFHVKRPGAQFCRGRGGVGGGHESPRTRLGVPGEAGLIPSDDGCHRVPPMTLPFRLIDRGWAPVGWHQYQGDRLRQRPGDEPGPGSVARDQPPRRNRPLGLFHVVAGGPAWTTSAQVPSPSHRPSDTWASCAPCRAGAGPRLGPRCPRCRPQAGDDLAPDCVARVGVVEPPSGSQSDVVASEADLIQRPPRRPLPPGPRSPGGGSGQVAQQLADDAVRRRCAR